MEERPETLDHCTMIIGAGLTITLGPAATTRGPRNARVDDEVTFFRLQMQRSLLLAKALEHHPHHRGQDAVYLRLTGITPPSQWLC